MKSVGFPSLGMGNLHYPADVSAKLLFQEIVEFQTVNQDSGMKYHVVVYDQATYKEFSKQYAQIMSASPPQRKVGDLLVISCNYKLVLFPEFAQEQQGKFWDHPVEH